ncbi:MAG TPA: PqqD family peptide modification chaperone [Nocardioides sp.]|nr:PqqD family peptide modification chaperone [Nocardioides sp.]
MTADAPIARTSGIVEAQFDEVRVLLNEDLEYLGLDDVGQRVWDLLAEPRGLGDLVSVLTEEYDVSAEQCRLDVGRFVDALERHGLVARG